MMTVLAIAVAMSIDAFCVSLCIGMKYHEVKHYLRLGIAFGFFQFIMPLIGAWAGTAALSYSDHMKYVAIGILIYVAVIMLKSARANEECKVYPTDPTKGGQLILLSLATSMDALGVGLAIPVMGLHIFWTALVIGVVCVIASMFGVYCGRFSSKYIGHVAEYAGAAVLTVIALKIAVTL